MPDTTLTDVPIPRLYPDGQRLAWNGTVIALKLSETRLLSLLAQRNIHGATLDMVNAALWPANDHILANENSSRRQVIASLRGKLTEAGVPIAIEVNRGTGLICISPVEIVTA